MTVWLKANQLSFVVLDYLCGHQIFLSSSSETIQDRKNFLQFCGFLSGFNCIFPHVRFLQKEHTNKHKVVAERGCCVVKVEDLVANKVPREWVLLENFNIPTMSDNEEDFGDFPSEYKEKSKESLIGAYRAESTLQYTTGSGIKTKIDGSTSWFKHERLMHKGLLNRESLRATGGVKNFRNTLRPHFTKGAQNVFLWRFYQFNRARRGSSEMVKWIGKFSLSLQRSRDAWMDNLPMSSMSEEQRQGQYLADVAQENAERKTRGETASDPNTPGNRERWNTAQVNDHESLFPFSDHLITLMFIVATGVSEAQRETYKSPFS